MKKWIGLLMMATRMYAMDLITIEHEGAACLHTVCEEFGEDEFVLAKTISDQLYEALTPYLPAAGLAAPQIGISRSIFIFSYDRDPAHLVTAINPAYEPMGERQIYSWEGCLSAVKNDGSYIIANVPRYEKIHACYTTLEGKRVSYTMEGFAAKVFQHEWDHLQGIENFEKEEAEVRVFPNREAMIDFFAEVKKEDSKHYVKPEQDGTD